MASDRTHPVLDPTLEQQALGRTAAAAGFVDWICRSAERQTEDARELLALVRRVMGMHAEARAAELDAKAQVKRRDELLARAVAHLAPTIHDHHDGGWSRHGEDRHAYEQPIRDLLADIAGLDEPKGGPQ